MITNEREYRITRAQIRELQHGLSNLEAQEPRDGVHPALAEASRHALRDQIRELEEAVTEFELLKTGGKRSWVLESLGSIPDTIIQARIASGMTQRALAEQLGVKEQQVQRYEATHYRGVSLDRIEQVVAATGLQVRIFAWAEPSEALTHFPMGFGPSTNVVQFTEGRRMDSPRLLITSALGSQATIPEGIDEAAQIFGSRYPGLMMIIDNMELGAVQSTYPGRWTYYADRPAETSGLASNRTPAVQR